MWAKCGLSVASDSWVQRVFQSGDPLEHREIHAGQCLNGADLTQIRYAQPDRILSIAPNGVLAASSSKVYRVSDGAPVPGPGLLARERDPLLHGRRIPHQPRRARAEVSATSVDGAGAIVNRCGSNEINLGAVRTTGLGVRYNARLPHVALWINRAGAASTWMAAPNEPIKSMRRPRES